MTKPTRQRRTSASPQARSRRGLKTDLELARAKISGLRRERDQLRALQRSLSGQLDQLASQSLVDRVDQLTQHNQQLAAETDRLQEDNETLRRHLEEAEEDLSGVRTALRRQPGPPVA